MSSIGLALSGGGAKGAAHIGVLQALKEEGVKVDYISGTSSGSIVATLFACGYNPYQILDIFNIYCKNIADYDKMLPFKVLNTMFTGNLRIKGFAKGDKLEETIWKFCMNKNIFDVSQIKMPIAIPTVDLNTGEVIYYTNTVVKEEEDGSNNREMDDIPSYKYFGRISEIVRASCSFPAVFEPKILDGKVLVDGGVRVNTPISILRKMGAEKVIAVHFNKKDKCNSYCSNIVSIALKAFDIMGHQGNEHELNSADYVLELYTEDVGLLDGSRTGIIATQGYMTLKSNIQELKEKLGIY